VAAAALCAVAGLAVLAAYVYADSRKDVIAPGIRAADVDVGGLKSGAARAKLEHVLIPRLEQPITVTAAGRTFTVPVKRIHPRIDVDGLVRRAVSRSQQGFFVTRAVDAATGATTNANLSAPVSYSHRVLDRLADGVAARVDRPVREASVQPSLSGLHKVSARNGRRIDDAALRHDLAVAVANPGAPRTVAAHVTITHPKVTTASLARRYPSYVVIDRGAFQLRLYRHLKLSRTFPIAVGMQGLETPAGLYDVQWKQLNPPWIVPNSPWAGALAGKVIPPGPQDPLKAAFISFNGSAGMHGIDPSEYGTIGHNASHGCVRMRIPDVLDLYRQVQVHTPVYIG
jgi:lipoprotein-anchoring transpeptidase ErfK/SrfK